MFNGHIAERRRAKVLQAKEHTQKEASIRKRYHTEIQPILLDHYKKRLKSFILKMQENPIIINPENLLPSIIETSRFTFKNSEDWNSMFPQRLRREQKWHQTFLQKAKTLPKLEQGAHRPKNHEFRSRQKEKQLHAPMRYKTVQRLSSSQGPKKTFTIKEFPSNKKSATRTPSKLQNHTNNFRQSMVTVSNNSSNKYQDGEDLEFNYRDRTDNIEIQARMYEKRKEPDEKKLHFKKLANMALNSTDQYEKRELREILKKTGYSKIKKIGGQTQSTEPDYFTTLVEKASIR